MSGLRTAGRVGLKILVLPAIIAAVVRLRRRRRQSAGRWFDEGGGTAGDREPRNPLPTTLTDAGAGIPGH